jgi:hypothetical protein
MRLTAGGKASIIAGSVFDGQNSPAAQADKNSVDEVLD